MVNPESPAFKISERLGFVIGRVIRYTVIAGGVVVLGRFLKNTTLPNKPPTPPASY